MTTDSRRSIRFAWVSACTALCAGLYANEYYVSPTGQTSNDGSREAPWPTVEHALDRVGGGHVIIVRPGLYREPIVVKTGWAGTGERPTVIRAEIKWRATIAGSHLHCIWTEPDCSWVVIDGFNVFGAARDGIKIIGDHTVVRNCWVHNNVSMGIACHGRKHNTFERNLVEYNGSHVQFHHGLYISGEQHRIVGNIVRHNAGWGLHLYQEISDSLIANNLVYGQAHRPGMILRCPEGGGRNRVVNNTFAHNGSGIDIARGNGEVVVNNILVAKFDPIAYYKGTTSLLVDYNLCVPRSAHQGPHGLSAEPLFVDPAKGVYWLKPGSPAIGKGSRKHAPASDFWNRQRTTDHPPDLGCFPFVPHLATDRARQSWYYQWPYQFYPNKKMGLPDLWALPSIAGKDTPRAN